MRDNSRNRNVGRDGSFDRTFVGKPGCMVLLLLAIIVGSLLYNYFNKIQKIQKNEAVTKLNRRFFGLKTKGKSPPFA